MLDAVRSAGEVSAAECAEHVGISRVSARRYLEHYLSAGAWSYGFSTAPGDRSDATTYAAGRLTDGGPKPGPSKHLGPNRSTQFTYSSGSGGGGGVGGSGWKANFKALWRVISDTSRPAGATAGTGLAQTPHWAPAVPAVSLAPVTHRRVARSSTRPISRTSPTIRRSRHQLANAGSRHSRNRTSIHPMALDLPQRSRPVR